MIYKFLWEREGISPSHLLSFNLLSQCQLRLDPLGLAKQRL